MTSIGIVTTWFERGAAYVSLAYRDVLASRFDVYIYARGGEKYAQEEPKWNSGRIYWSPNKRADTIIDRDDFVSWIRSREIKAILFNEQGWWPPVLWARELGVKTVGYVDYYTPRSVPWFWLYDGLWCNTNRHFSVFNWHPRAQYIPWGTDLKLFQPKSPFCDSQLVFFHSAGMGGTNLRKGTDLVVRAFQMVNGSVQLVIHSQVPIEHYGLVANLIRLDTRIQFVEGTVAAPGLYHMGHVYVYPTRLEGIGLTIPEALACGLPVITTDIAPGNEFVSPDTNGWLAKVVRAFPREDDYYWPQVECDVEDLARLMRNCVEDRDAVELRSQGARLYAEHQLDWRKNSCTLCDQMAAIICEPPVKVPKLIQWDMVNSHAANPSRIWRLFNSYWHRHCRLVRMLKHRKVS